VIEQAPETTAALSGEELWGKLLKSEFVVLPGYFSAVAPTLWVLLHVLQVATAAQSLSISYKVV
jgi:hypothetical protein